MKDLVNEEILGEVVGGAKPAEAPGKGLKWYQIKPGDTLIKIAEKFGTNYQYLARINNISNPNLIRAGKWIRVPA